MCEVASWLPAAVSATLRERSAPPVLAWLTVIRGVTEEYDPLVTVRPPTPSSDTSEASNTTADSAFDEILSQLGREIFKLDEYQENLSPKEQEVSLSILNLFDECLDDMTVLTPVAANCEVETPVTRNEEKQTNEVTSVCDECSDIDSTLTDVSYVTSTPCKGDEMKPSDLIDNSDSTVPPPIPPRARLRTTSYDMEKDELERESDSDSESTCWSYKECSTDAESDARDRYAAVWSHSTGFHNSDDIMRRVITQHHASESRVAFDTASEFTLSQYPVYSLEEVGEAGRCDAPVAAMTPDKRCEDGYEPVRDAITIDENIYEEIEYGYSYTDEGCSCGGSVEVESCSVSASSEGVGRESPMYANLRDHDAYAVPPDVIFWKNLLAHPFYNDDEEDEWITPEECAVYSREQRPPFVIPRIPHYTRAPRYQHHGHSYTEDSTKEGSIKSRSDWSPGSERGRAELDHSFSKANSDSPPFSRINKRLGGSTENLLANLRRPNHLNLPASSSGDSLDVEVRETRVPQGRGRKSKSMMTPKLRMRSPVPAPRVVLHQPVEAPIFLEAPVKRTRFTDNGKKVRKNWMECYMILTPTALLFYKDLKSYHASKAARSPPSPGGARAELVLALRHAHVVLAKQMHTRRYTRSLVVEVDYDEYLVQVETEDAAKRLLSCIQNVIYSLGPPTIDDYPPKYQSSTTDLESLGRTPPVSRHNQRTKQKVGGSSNEDLSDSTESKSHVKSRLKKFFARRPAMEVLVKKGIYKDEPVFGRNLDEVCPSASPRVPEFVVACVREIEASDENMSTDGLYRASGNLSQVQKIRLEVDQNNTSVIENNTDIHVLTGSLKLFFRELKEPLIPCSMFDRVLSACSIKPKEAKIKEFRDIVQALPQCNRDTLKFLLEHLLRVTKYSEKNRMHTANLAIVFGPTLLWAPAEQAHNIAIDCIQQNNVVDILLTEFKQIFTEDMKGKKKT